MLRLGEDGGLITSVENAPEPKPTDQMARSTPAKPADMPRFFCSSWASALASVAVAMVSASAALIGAAPRLGDDVFCVDTPGLRSGPTSRLRRGGVAPLCGILHGKRASDLREQRAVISVPRVEAMKPLRLPLSISRHLSSFPIA